MEISRMVRLAVVLGTISTLAVACATSPLGRKQLLLLPDSQMDSMGGQAFDQMKSQVPTDSDPADNKYVQCIALPLTEAARSQVSIDKWEIVVFKDQSANAFALPGGKIGVHTGMFPVAKTPDQLAADIGHEIGHVIAKHGAERASEQLATQGVEAGLAALMGNSGVSQIGMAALGLGSQFAVALPHSRTQESEADLIGLDLMARAGFDPAQSIELWHNMSVSGGGKAPPEWLSTHPANQNRIDALQAHMPDAKAKYEKAKVEGKAPNCIR